MKNEVHNLSPLEKKVMNIIWTRGTSSVRDVLEHVQAEKDFAYTTVATILARLNTKGFLKRSEKNNVVYFAPKITKEKFSKSVIGAFVNSSFLSFGDIAIASFAESIDELPKAKKDYFLKLLTSHDKKA